MPCSLRRRPSPPPESVHAPRQSSTRQTTLATYQASLAGSFGIAANGNPSTAMNGG